MIARRSACEKLAHIAISSNVRLQPTQKPESGSTVQIFMQGVSMGWKLSAIGELSQVRRRRAIDARSCFSYYRSFRCESNHMFRICMRLLGVLVAVGCAQFAVASDFYNVRIELTRDGKVVAQPILIVSEGKEAKFSISGGENYEVKVVVTALPENQVKLETNIQTEHGGFYPTFVSRDGQPVEAAMNQYRARFIVSRNRS